MYMLNFVDYVKNFGFNNWLDYVVYSLGFIYTFVFILFLLFSICFKIYKVISLIDKVEDLENEVKKLKKGGKK